MINRGLKTLNNGLTVKEKIVYDFKYTDIAHKISEVKDKVEYTNYKGQREVKSLNPPQVVKLVYHDTGKDSEFCGVVVRENHYTSKGEFYNLDKEIMLTDNAANQIIDLLAGDSKWSNKTSIEYSTTTSPNLLPPKRF